MAQSTNTSGPTQINRFQKKEITYDLTRAGQGTPWENRGEYGSVSAFLRTCLRVMTKPGLLLDHIRSVTQTEDARLFAWVCAALWGVSVLVHAIVGYAMVDRDAFEVHADQYVINTAVQVAVGVGWAFGMTLLCANLYHKLVATEIKSVLPTPLTFNIVAYCMGPSLLAPLPFVGPPLALAWILVALMAAGRARLFISWRGAIIDAILAFGVVIVLTAVLYFAGGFLWNFVMPPAVEKQQQMIRFAPAG